MVGIQVSGGFLPLTTHPPVRRNITPQINVRVTREYNSEKKVFMKTVPISVLKPKVDGKKKTRKTELKKP